MPNDLTLLLDALDSLWVHQSEDGEPEINCAECVGTRMAIRELQARVRENRAALDVAGMDEEALLNVHRMAYADPSVMLDDGEAGIAAVRDYILCTLGAQAGDVDALAAAWRDAYRRESDRVDYERRDRPNGAITSADLTRCEVAGIMAVAALCAGEAVALREVVRVAFEACNQSQGALDFSEAWFPSDHAAWTHARTHLDAAWAALRRFFDAHLALANPSAAVARAEAVIEAAFDYARAHGRWYKVAESDPYGPEAEPSHIAMAEKQQVLFHRLSALRAIDGKDNHGGPRSDARP